MYHPTRGGVRGGRDQFSWEDVKVDKHRENYLGHSIKAPVGRWQKGKDLHWYSRDKKSSLNLEAAREEIKQIKEQEEQAMREALGLAPKTDGRSHGSRLDKHEFSELVKRGCTAEDLGAGHAEAARVQGLGFSRAPRAWEESSSLQLAQTGTSTGLEKVAATDPPLTRNAEEVEDEDDNSSKKRRHEEKRKRREERYEKQKERCEKHEKYEKRHSRDTNDRKKRRSDKEKGRHDSD